MQWLHDNVYRCPKRKVPERQTIDHIEEIIGVTNVEARSTQDEKEEVVEARSGQIVGVAENGLLIKLM